MIYTPLNIRNLLTMVEGFLGNVYFQHCFNNPPSNLFDLNSKAFGIELGIVWIQVGKGH